MCIRYLSTPIAWNTLLWNHHFEDIFTTDLVFKQNCRKLANPFTAGACCSEFQEVVAPLTNSKQRPVFLFLQTSQFVPEKILSSKGMWTQFAVSHPSDISFNLFPMALFLPRSSQPDSYRDTGTGLGLVTFIHASTKSISPFPHEQHGKKSYTNLPFGEQHHHLTAEHNISYLSAFLSSSLPGAAQGWLAGLGPWPAVSKQLQ